MFPPSIELAELFRQRGKAILNIRTLQILGIAWSDTREAVLNLRMQLAAIEVRIADLNRK
jgi:hypothetical protein